MTVFDSADFVIPAGRRIYAVGDLHGRLDLFVDLQVRIDADLGANPSCIPTEVYLGDVVDRGPDSARLMIALLRRMQSRDVVVLAGNHELAMIHSLSDPKAFRRWLREGGRATVASFGLGPEEQLEQTAYFEKWQSAASRLVEYFAARLVPLYRAGGYVFVHAGLRPGVPLILQDLLDLTMIREPFLGSAHNFGFKVVHGHTPVPEAEFLPHRINLDTGAYATGKLSCAVLEANRFRLL